MVFNLITLLSSAESVGDCKQKDKMSDFKAEYAKSGRASCKGCKGTISQDSLRLAVMVQVSSAPLNFFIHSFILYLFQLRAPQDTLTQSCRNLFPVCQTIGLADVDNVSDLFIVIYMFLFKAYTDFKSNVLDLMLFTFSLTCALF